MADPTIWLERRSRGPGGTERGYTAQGGYFCGRIAQIAPTARTIKITSKAGVPIERSLTVRVLGDSVEVFDGQHPIAHAISEPLAVEPLAPPKSLSRHRGALRALRREAIAIQPQSVSPAVISVLKAMGSEYSRDR